RRYAPISTSPIRATICGSISPTTRSAHWGGCSPRSMVPTMAISMKDCRAGRSEATLLFEEIESRDVDNALFGDRCLGGYAHGHCLHAIHDADLRLAALADDAVEFLVLEKGRAVMVAGRQQRGVDFHRFDGFLF